MQQNAATKFMSTRTGTGRRAFAKPARQRTTQIGTTYLVEDVVQPSAPTEAGTDLPGSAPVAKRGMTLSGPKGLAENAEVHSV